MKQLIQDIREAVATERAIASFTKVLGSTERPSTFRLIQSLPAAVKECRDARLAAPSVETIALKAAKAEEWSRLDRERRAKQQAKDAQEAEARAWLVAHGPHGVKPHWVQAIVQRDARMAARSQARVPVTLLAIRDPSQGMGNGKARVDATTAALLRSMDLRRP